MASTELDTGLSARQYMTFFQSRSNVLYGVNGIDRGKRWDGYAATMGDIGTTAPTVLPTVTLDTGGAATAGSYDCAYRYKTVTPEGTTYSSFSPLRTVTATANQEFNWTITASAESHPTHVELWRTTVGETNVYYLVDTITGTTAVDQLSDATLISNAVDDEDAVIVYIQNNGEPSANRFTPPPEDKAHAVVFQDRAWYFGYVRLRGVCTLDGDTTITAESDFPLNTVGWQIAIEGETQVFTIDAAIAGVTLTLDTAVTQTASDLVYTAYPPIASQRQLLYSAPDEFESVPVTNEVIIQDNVGDDQYITGAKPWGNTLYVFCERSKYGVSFVRQPNIDASVRLIDDRGAFNHRCIGDFEDTFYCMDQQGCYAFSVKGGGRGAMSENISDAIKDQWRDGVVDFSDSDNFFVEVDRNTATVRFWVTFGDGVSNRCFVWNVRKKTWDHERYETPSDNGYRASTQVVIDESGVSQKTRSLVCGSNGRIFTREGTTEIMTAVEDGTLNASSSTGCTIADISGWAGFNTRSHVGAIMYFTATGQTAVIKTQSLSTNALTVTYAETLSSNVPASTAAVKVGVIPFSWKSRRLPVITTRDTPEASKENKRGFEFIFPPFSGDFNTLNLRVFENFSAIPMQFAKGADFTSGLTISVLDLDQHESESLFVDTIQMDMDVDRFDTNVPANGYMELELNGRFQTRAESLRYLTLEINGYQGDDAITINEINFVGFTK